MLKPLLADANYSGLDGDRTSLKAVSIKVYCCLVILLVNVVASLPGTPRLTEATFTWRYFCCSLAFFFLLDNGVPVPMNQQMFEEGFQNETSQTSCGKYTLILKSTLPLNAIPSCLACAQPDTTTDVTLRQQIAVSRT